MLLVLDNFSQLITEVKIHIWLFSMLLYFIVILFHYARAILRSSKAPNIVALFCLLIHSKSSRNWKLFEWNLPETVIPTSESVLNIIFLFGDIKTRLLSFNNKKLENNTLVSDFYWHWDFCIWYEIGSWHQRGAINIQTLV